MSLDLALPGVFNERMVPGSKSINYELCPFFFAFHTSLRRCISYTLSQTLVRLGGRITSEDGEGRRRAKNLSYSDAAEVGGKQFCCTVQLQLATSSKRTHVLSG